MSKFAMIGVGGYVAPRHLKAISDTGNELVAAFDINDSVGVLDSYFPTAKFFSEFERFDRHIDKIRRRNHGRAVDYISVCSPNYLHDAHIRFALRSNAHAICEKPLVLSPWNLDALTEIERETDRKVNTILQLRLHPSMIELKQQILQADKKEKYDVDLTYVTPRGPWYGVSWKGDKSKSGGVASNIGVHFFDLLVWLFGSVSESKVNLSSDTKMAGYIELENARVRWFLSVDADDLPADIKPFSKPYRSITLNGSEIEFSGGFNDLHSRSYYEILKGEGFGIEEARSAVEVTYDIRNSESIGLVGDYHPMLKKMD